MFLFTLVIAIQLGGPRAEDLAPGNYETRRTKMPARWAA